MNQDDIFLDTEGDSWFNRNKEYLKNKKDDIIMTHLRSYSQLRPESRVLEVGCSTGYRLDKIKQEYGSRCYGIDASKEAIAFGKAEFPSIDLSQGAASELPFESASFDLVIINFVLHWIDRKNLLKVVSELDRVLKKDGLLLIGDFYPRTAEKRLYHHIKEPVVYTYKQNYFDLFTATGLYALVENTVFDHSTMSKGLSVDFDNRCSLTLLKKSESDLYVSR